MIKTQYEITIEIDEDKFGITLREPNAAQREELTSLSQENIAAYEKKTALIASLREKETEFELNKEIISCSSLLEKLPLLLEQKRTMTEINSLKKEIETVDKSLKNANGILETLYEKRFDLLVSGGDKFRLKEVIKEKGVSYITLFEHFAQLAAEAKEKK